jgi:hypothetical protein
MIISIYDSSACFFVSSFLFNFVFHAPFFVNVKL